MVNSKFVESLIAEFRAGLPGGLTRDMESSVRAVLMSVLSRLDLVTREELDVQMQVLARTRARLEELEKQVADLEKLARRT